MRPRDVVTVLLLQIDGAPEEIRTPNLLIRSAKFA
jgi:hypothetical protein